MVHYSIDVIKAWERFYRANFLNSVSGFKATHLVATVNEAGTPNLALFHNIVHLGADPALIGMVNRPRAAAPHTIANIEATGWWTLNSVHTAILEKAHQSSAKYADGVNEFEEVGLTAEYKEELPVPVVAESAIQYALKLVEIITITHNNTFFIIGSIEHVWLQEGLASADGFVNLDQAKVICSSGLDGYYLPEYLDRFRYARPGIEVERHL
jgi:flavin reductase (DIM6/NTAB) family NADH-FMN oxidoreductase RutF